MTQSTTEPIYLTHRDIQTRLRLSRGSVNRAIRAGTIPKPVRFNRLLRWRLVDFIAWEEQATKGVMREAQI